MARLIDNGAVVFVPASNLHSDRKACKCDSEAGHIKINDQICFSLNDRVQLIITQANKQKRSLIATVVS
jgi:exoribonuclease-2